MAQSAALRKPCRVPSPAARSIDRTLRSRSHSSWDLGGKEKKKPARSRPITALSSAYLSTARMCFTPRRVQAGIARAGLGVHLTQRSSQAEAADYQAKRDHCSLAVPYQLSRRAANDAQRARLSELPLWRAASAGDVLVRRAGGRWCAARVLPVLPPSNPRRMLNPKAEEACAFVIGDAAVTSSHASDARSTCPRTRRPWSSIAAVAAQLRRGVDRVRPAMKQAPASSAWLRTGWHGRWHGRWHGAVAGRHGCAPRSLLARGGAAS